uniref:Uncharacterized protein n=1 Tax=Rhizophora mucronata TaxID=61149 RepID=A0A2P2LCX3_RHIMU
MIFQSFLEERKTPVNQMSCFSKPTHMLGVASLSLVYGVLLPSHDCDFFLFLVVLRNSVGMSV